MSIAGIDYSSHAIDLVILNDDDDTASWTRHHLEGQDAFDRARRVREAVGWLRYLGDDHGVIACGIEEPRGHGAGSLYRIQGAILACLWPTLLVQPLIPSAWRKLVGLPGNAPKHAIASWVLNTWPHADVSQLPQDALDAYAIAYATRLLLARSQIPAPTG